MSTHDATGIASSRPPVRTGRRPGLDVIRGIAVGLVLLCHAWPETLSGGGIVGVVLFFALSGYLITGVLLRNLERSGRVSYGSFYAHRFFRLYPALVAMLAIYTVLGRISHQSAIGAFVRNDLSSLFYVGDVPLNGLHPAAGMGHLWTLAVEEQFYLVWPWVLTWAVSRSHVGRALAVSAAVAVAADLAWFAIARHHAATFIYESPTSWTVALLIGCAARVYRHRLSALATMPLVGASLTVIFAASLVRNADHHPAAFLPMAPVIAGCAVVLILKWEQWDYAPRAASPLLGLGTISYAAYLWNFPIATMLSPTNNTDMSIGRASASIALTIGAALLSWYTVEALGRSWRVRFDAKQVVHNS